MLNFEVVFNCLIHAALSFVASSAFAIIYHSPKKQVISAGITGTVGWMIYIILTTFFDCSSVFSSFAATVGLGLVARIFSVIRKSPATIYIVTGMFPIVPGLMIYKTSYSLFMSGDPSETFALGLTTMEVAVAIALGIALVMSLPQSLFNIFRKKEVSKTDD